MKGAAQGDARKGAAAPARVHAPWFPALEAFIENVGYEVVMMADGSRSAVPMDTAQPLAELERAKKMALALERVLVEELNGRLCARPESPEDLCCDNCRETWRLVDEALSTSANSHPRGDE